MRKRWMFLLVGALAFAACDGDDDDDDDGPEVQNFGPAPLAACTNPEGVAVDDQGSIWAGSVRGGGATTICKLNPRGEIVDLFVVTPEETAPGANIGGLLFVPGEGLYFTDFGDFNDPVATANKRVLLLNPTTRAVTTIATQFLSPNALVRDADGNLYVSDSAEGRIYRIANDAPRTKTVWKEDPLLRTDNAQLPFGANGLAFDAARQFMYVANTGEATIVRITRNGDGTAGPAALFAEGAQLGTNALAGADGIAFDNQGNLYVCANQANEIQVLSVSGTTPAITRRFAGQDGNAFVFPASIAFSGNQAYIANLAFGTPAPAGKLSVVRTPNPGAAP